MHSELFINVLKNKLEPNEGRKKLPQTKLILTYCAAEVETGISLVNQLESPHFNEAT